MKGLWRPWQKIVQLQFFESFSDKQGITGHIKWILCSTQMMQKGYDAGLNRPSDLDDGIRILYYTTIQQPILQPDNVIQAQTAPQT